MAAQPVGRFMFLLMIGSQAAGDLSKVKAKPGESITLQCNSPTDAAITNLVWTRTDLEDDYVFFFRHNRTNENYQDPRFHGRVELKDPEMKNGDASVVLKNVRVDDTGKYQCQVIPSMNRRKRNVGELGTLVSFVQLTVSEGPENVEPWVGQPQSGQAALRAGPGFLSLLLLLLVVVVGFL
ncbi:Coxsackievirus and adenovirus receptor like [Dissostichus eleginoides]|uniref:Coxsackievirus and adenovirus receptor like n=1 Tax=Dissostichus eleginoides TaxID=100907 RepID=A0AAD9BW41_DISEL|nr:Coxsackievirus and adenovirus receptor like [Dissostichus eleginoides]